MTCVNERINVLIDERNALRARVAELEAAQKELAVYIRRDAVLRARMAELEAALTAIEALPSGDRLTWVQVKENYCSVRLLARAALAEKTHAKTD